MDGSARPFVNLILQGEPVEQDKERVYFELDAPVSISTPAPPLAREAVPSAFVPM